MKAAQYAEAIFLAAHNKDDAGLEAVRENTVRLLNERGHVRLLPAIVRELEKLQQTRQSSDACIVSVAKESDAAQYRTAIEKDVRTLEAEGMRIDTHVDSTAVGGYAVLAGGKRIDRTHKRSLVSMYSKLINSNSL